MKGIGTTHQIPLVVLARESPITSRKYEIVFREYQNSLVRDVITKKSKKRNISDIRKKLGLFRVSGSSRAPRLVNDPRRPIEINHRAADIKDIKPDSQSIRNNLIKQASKPLCLQLPKTSAITKRPERVKSLQAFETKSEENSVSIHKRVLMDNPMRRPTASIVHREQPGVFSAAIPDITSKSWVV